MKAATHSGRTSPPRKSIGDRLRDQLEDILQQYVAGMRSDPDTPRAAELSTAQIEDHAMSFLVDVFQTVAIQEALNAGETVEEADVLLADSAEIQRLISELHGRQRQGLGFTMSAIGREYEIFRGVIEAFIRRQQTPEPALAFALDLVRQMMERACAMSLTGFRAAGGSVTSRA